MATVTNATLTLTSLSASKATLRVQGSVDFTANDIGIPHRLGIALYAVQAPDDSPSEMDLVGGGLLYTFQWGTLLLQRPYLSVTPQSIGPWPFDVTREVLRTALNEDPGSYTHPPPQPDTPSPSPFPKKDEVKAVVHIAQVHTYDSNVVEEAF